MTRFARCLLSCRYGSAPGRLNERSGSDRNCTFKRVAGDHFASSIKFREARVSQLSFPIHLVHHTRSLRIEIENGDSVPANERAVAVSLNAKNDDTCTPPIVLTLCVYPRISYPYANARSRHT